MAVSDQLHATSALPPPPVEMVASTLRWGGFGESEWRSGRFGEEKSRMEPRSDVSPARSCRCGVATIFKVMKPWSSVKLKAAELLLLTTYSHRNHAECAIVWFRFFFQLRRLSARYSPFALQFVYNRRMLDRLSSIPSWWTDYKRRTSNVYVKWGSCSFFVSKDDKGVIPSHHGPMVYLFHSKLTFINQMVASGMCFNP